MMSGISRTVVYWRRRKADRSVRERSTSDTSLPFHHAATCRCVAAALAVPLHLGIAVCLGIGGRGLAPVLHADAVANMVHGALAVSLAVIVGHLDNRWLYPAGSSHWSAKDRSAIQTLARKFRPGWDLPAGEFSDWHHFVLSPARSGGVYRPEPLSGDLSQWRRRLTYATCHAD